MMLLLCESNDVLASSSLAGTDADARDTRTLSVVSAKDRLRQQQQPLPDDDTNNDDDNTTTDDRWMSDLLESTTAVPLSSSSSSSPFEVDLRTMDWSSFPIVGHAEPQHGSSSSTVATRVASTSIMPSFESSPFLSQQQPKTVSMSLDKRQLPSSLPASTVRTETEGSSNGRMKKRSRRSRRYHRSVRFATTLEVRTLPITLGDHPCCSSGMALTCDLPSSSPQQQQRPGQGCNDEVVNFELFEMSSQKRRQSALRLNYQERRRRLMNATGWSGFELLQEERSLREQEEQRELRWSSTATTVQGAAAPLCCRRRALHHTRSFANGMEGMLKVLEA